MGRASPDQIVAEMYYQLLVLSHPVLCPGFAHNSTARAFVAVLWALIHSQESQNPPVQGLFLSRERQQNLPHPSVLILLCSVRTRSSEISSC